MIKELRKMRAKGGRDRSVANYVSELQHRGKLRKIITDKGYVDTKRGLLLPLFDEENENE